MHALRQRTLLRAVEALVHGGRLTLIDLARAWPGATRVRAPLKACDRLLCNRTLQVERSAIERDMAHWLLRGDQPVIVIDWSDLKPDKSWCLLRAAVPVGGRTLTLLDMVVSGKQQGIARRGETLFAAAQGTDSRRCASDPGHGCRIPHAMVSRGVGDGLGLGRALTRAHAGQNRKTCPMMQCNGSIAVACMRWRPTVRANCRRCRPIAAIRSIAVWCSMPRHHRDVSNAIDAHPPKSRVHHPV